jgi:hypothetical protein
MTTVMDRGAGTSMGRGRPGAARPSRPLLTLADLITAIQDVVGPEDDRLVVATVRCLLRSGRLKGLRAGTYRCPPQGQKKALSQIVTGGGQPPERDGTPVTLLPPESMVKRRAGSHRERSQSIAGKEVQRHGRLLAVHRSSCSANGAWGAAGSRPLLARADRAEAGPSLTGWIVWPALGQKTHAASHA